MTSSKTCRHNIVVEHIRRCRCITNHNTKATYWKCASCDQVLSKKSEVLRDKNYVYDEDFDVWVHTKK